MLLCHEDSRSSHLTTHISHPGHFQNGPRHLRCNNLVSSQKCSGPPCLYRVVLHPIFGLVLYFLGRPPEWHDLIDQFIFHHSGLPKHHPTRVCRVLRVQRELLRGPRYSHLFRVHRGPHVGNQRRHRTLVARDSHPLVRCAQFLRRMLQHFFCVNRQPYLELVFVLSSPQRQIIFAHISSCPLLRRRLVGSGRFRLRRHFRLLCWSHGPHDRRYLASPSLLLLRHLPIGHQVPLRSIPNWLRLLVRDSALKGPRGVHHLGHVLRRREPVLMDQLRPHCLCPLHRGLNALAVSPSLFGRHSNAYGPLLLLRPRRLLRGRFGLGAI
mmetsp:Transcript_85708/g.179073  ORF Transcript_85708/g.179073 Transcript_85708/m.179073 type:complete len:324 (+) Transcript_85708:1030-2001(+)